MGWRARSRRPSRQIERERKAENHHGNSTIQTDYCRAPRRHGQRLCRADAGARPKRLCSCRSARPAAATTRGGSPPGIAAAATSGMYRLIDFRRNKDGVPAKVRLDSVRSEPHRPHRPAALRRRREALHPGPAGLKAGDQVLSGPDAPPTVGNCLPLKKHSAGHGDSQHRVAARPRRACCAARPASSATLAAREADWAQITLPSGEIRRVPSACRATIGATGNADHMNDRVRQGGPQALDGPPPARPRHGDEPDRPSARRWRRPHQGRSPSGQPDGQAGQGRRHPQASQAVERGDRSPPPFAALRPAQDSSERNTVAGIADGRRSKQEIA